MTDRESENVMDIRDLVERDDKWDMFDHQFRKKPAPDVDREVESHEFEGSHEAVKGWEG